MTGAHPNVQRPAPQHGAQPQNVSGTYPQAQRQPQHTGAQPGLRRPAVTGYNPAVNAGAVPRADDGPSGYFPAQADASPSGQFPNSTSAIPAITPRAQQAAPAPAHQRPPTTGYHPSVDAEAAPELEEATLPAQKTPEELAKQNQFLKEKTGAEVDPFAYSSPSLAALALDLADESEIFVAPKFLTDVEVVNRRWPTTGPIPTMMRRSYGIWSAGAGVLLGMVLNMLVVAVTGAQMSERVGMVVGVCIICAIAAGAAGASSPRKIEALLLKSKLLPDDPHTAS